MSNLVVSTYCNVSSRLATRNETGSQTAEYGVVILVATGLALACLQLVTKGAFDTVLRDLMVAVLKKATNLAK